MSPRTNRAMTTYGGWSMSSWMFETMPREHLVHIAGNIWRRMKVWPSTCRWCREWYLPKEHPKVVIK